MRKPSVALAAPAQSSRRAAKALACARVKRIDGTVCGQRSYFVRVTQTGALGRVRVSVTIP